MPTITAITEQKRAKNRRNIHLDGQFAFGCNVAVVARFRLRVGMELNAEQIAEIERGGVKQACFDHALRLLAGRLHSRAELVKKMAPKEYGPRIVDAVMEDLARYGYVDDAKFAIAKAQAAATQKHHGRRRAALELRRSGVSDDLIESALNSVYGKHDSTRTARRLAEKQAPRLRQLDPVAARRRLIGMLQRRGFDYEEIRDVVEQVLGD